MRKKIAAGILMSSLVFAGASYGNPMNDTYGTENHQGQQMHSETGRQSGEAIRQEHTVPQNQGIHNNQDRHQEKNSHNAPKHNSGKGGKRHR